MGTLSYSKTVTPTGTYQVLECPGLGRIAHTASVAFKDGDTATISGRLYLETEAPSIFEPDQVKVTIASAKAICNGTTRVNITSSTTLNDGDPIGATKTLGSYSFDISKAHSSKSVSYKLIAGTLTVYVDDGVYSKTGTASCGTREGTLTVGAKTSYTVSYNANGGSGAPSSQTKWFNETLTLSTTKPTRTGYTFAGWNTNSSGTGTNYAPGGYYTANSGVTLYAKWTENTATLSYNNGGHGTTPGAVTMRYSAQTNAAGALSATGYTFNGWKRSDNGTVIGAGTVVKSANVNPYALTLTAQWTENTATLSYNNGGHGTAPSSVTMRYTTQTNAAAAISADGWIFQGWKRSDNGTVIGAGAVVKSAYVNLNDLTLTAQWIAGIRKITLNNKGATISGTEAIWTKYEQGYYSDAECTNSITQINVPVKTHYGFDGYFLDTTSTRYINTNGSFTVAKPTFTSDMTFVAHWIPKIYIITLTNQDSTTAGTTKYYEKYDVGNYADENCTTQITTITKPQRIGYTFSGYYSGTNGEGNLYIDQNGKIKQTNIGSNSTLHPYWIINEYDLIFNLRGGIISSTTETLRKKLKYQETYSVRYGAFPEPTRVGYDFDGWYATIDGPDDEVTDYVMGDRDYVLYARWTPKTYTEIDNSYNYTTIETGQVAAVAKNSSFGTIPYSILDGNNTLIVTSLEECFKDTEINGYIYANCFAVNNVNNTFENMEGNACIVFGSEFEEFSDVWDVINQTYENVTYLGADDEDYYYTADENDTTNRNLNIRVKDKTKEMYGLPFLEIENDNDIWTPATMNKCYKGCQELQGHLKVNLDPCTFIYQKTTDVEVIFEKTYYIYNLETQQYEEVEQPTIADLPNYYELQGVEGCSEIFDGIIHPIYIWCINEEALPGWKYIVSLDDAEGE